MAVDTSRGADRHVIEALLEAARGEGYDCLGFTSTEKPQKDRPAKRTPSIKFERELDDLESIL
jgi:hypothetical protein